MLLPLFYIEKREKRKSVFCDVSAEGENCELDKLECLQAEGDADNGNTADDTRCEITERHFPTKDKEPKNIHDGMLLKLNTHIFTEGSEGELGKFEALDAKGDTNDGDAKEKSQDKPRKTEPDATENEPNQIAEKFHDTISSLIV
jgi:hypothetical protein